MTRNRLLIIIGIVVLLVGGVVVCIATYRFGPRTVHVVDFEGHALMADVYFDYPQVHMMHGGPTDSSGNIELTPWASGEGWHNLLYGQPELLVVAPRYQENRLPLPWQKEITVTMCHQDGCGKTATTQQTPATIPSTTLRLRIRH